MYVLQRTASNKFNNYWEKKKKDVKTPENNIENDVKNTGKPC